MTKASIHFGTSTLQAAVQIVYLQAVNFTDRLPLSNSHARLQRRHRRLLSFLFAEIVLAVVHHRVVVVVESIFAPLARDKFEILLEPRHNVVPVNLDEVVPISAGLFMIDSNGVHELMHDTTFAAEAVGACLIGLLQGDHLLSAPLADIRPATLRPILGWLNKQIILHLAIVWRKPDAGERIKCLQSPHYQIALSVVIPRTYLKRYRAIGPQTLGMPHGIHAQTQRDVRIRIYSNVALKQARHCLRIINAQIIVANIRTKWIKII